MIPVIRGGDSGYIGDVLPQCLLAFHGKVIEGFVFVILRGEFVGPLFKLLQVSGSPPVAHAALGVKRRAFRVKRVADLVSDHRSDGAVVDCGRSLWIEEWRLQDRGRKIETVMQGEI